MLALCVYLAVITATIPLQVNYHSYKRLKAEFPDGPLGGFTRLMHSSRPDDVLHLVPTIVVDHLPDGLDRGYGPMHR